MRFALSTSVSLAAGFLVAACGTTPSPSNKESKERTAIPQVSTPTQPSPYKESIETGLIDLPSPEDVIRSARPGRNDPFSPDNLISPSKTSNEKTKEPRPSIDPEDQNSEFFGFSVSGIIKTNGKSLAFVSLGEETGYVGTGDIGGITTSLIPKEWRVSKIDISLGQVVLAKDGQTVTAEF